MKKSTLSGITAILLAGVLAAGVCTCGYASRDKDTGKWFKNGDISSWSLTEKNEIKEKQGNSWGGVVDGEGNVMDKISTYAMPATMAFYSDMATTAEIAELSDPSVKITASHNFEYNNILVDWSAEYPSGASAADVLTVIPDSDGSLTASVSCSAPFSTRIILKVTSRDNPDVSASTTVDYIRRIGSVSNVGKILKAQQNNVLNSNSKTALDMDIDMGVGTINGDIVVKSLTLGVDFFGYIDCYRALLTESMSNKYSPQNYTLGNISLTSSDNVHFVSGSSVIDWRVSNFVRGYENASASEKQAVDYALYHAYKNNGSVANITASYVLQVKYNGAVIQEFTRWADEDKLTFVKWTGSAGAENLTPNLSLNTSVAL